MKSSIKFLSVPVLLLAATTAFAEPAIILTDFACGMMDGNGDYIFTRDTKVVSAIKKNGTNVNLKCYASDVANSTGKAVKWNYENTGLACGTQYGATDDWQTIVDTEGNAKLSCIVHLDEL